MTDFKVPLLHPNGWTEVSLGEEFCKPQRDVAGGQVRVGSAILRGELNGEFTAQCRPTQSGATSRRHRHVMLEGQRISRKSFIVLKSAAGNAVRSCSQA